VREPLLKRRLPADEHGRTRVAPDAADARCEVAQHEVTGRERARRRWPTDPGCPLAADEVRGSGVRPPASCSIAARTAPPTSVDGDDLLHALRAAASAEEALLLWRCVLSMARSPAVSPTLKETILALMKFGVPVPARDRVSGDVEIALGRGHRSRWIRPDPQIAAVIAWASFSTRKGVVDMRGTYPLLADVLEGRVVEGRAFRRRTSRSPAPFRDVELVERWRAYTAGAGDREPDE
jgi:hypothetical protein